jgi:anti-sigma regulatory factor (Ser/Thr protein kinase)
MIMTPYSPGPGTGKVTWQPAVVNALASSRQPALALVLWEWGLAALTDSVELVVSELVTNAVQASRATGQTVPVRLWLLSDKAQVLVLVWGASPHPPVQAAISDETENGRGLLLVEALSQQWAWYYAAPEWRILRHPLVRRVPSRACPAFPAWAPGHRA